MSGLGLEPRWLLNRLKTETVLIGSNAQHKSSQVSRKGETEAEGVAAVETRKKKEAVARAKCWKGSLLWGFKGTGEPCI